MRRDPLLLLVASMLAVALGACGSRSGGAGDDVRPFSEVQADEFRFEADPTDPTRGIFHVTTTEPMICAIVWGETESFGRFNNSQAMNGTGLTAHDVYLPDAVPGTTYSFRVQGTTADGTLHRSDTGTFTIPAIAGDATVGRPEPTGPNLAVDATVAEVSSEFGPGFEAVNAIDDDGTTEWSSAGDGDEASITLDLGATFPLAGVAFLTRSMADGTAIAETYTVTVDDGTPLGPFPAGNAADPRPSVVVAEGRVVRFDVASSTGGNVGAVEVQVIGT